MRSCLLFSFVLLFSFQPLFSQKTIKNELRGTLRARKLSPPKYYLNRENSLVKQRQARTFTVRAYGAVFKEYFPAGYESELYPLVFNNRGLLLVDEKKKVQDLSVESFYFGLFVYNIEYYSGTDTGMERLISQLRRMPKGSHIWVKNLVYYDKEGKVYEKKIGEFKIEKIQ